MITKREKIIWAVYGAALVLLFLASSTDLIIKERENPVYPISVVIEEDSDDQYVNFRKGMDQAAMELNADVSFITLYESSQAEQQLEMLRREKQDGAQALVVAPVDEGALETALEAEPLEVPLILSNGDGLAEYASAEVSVDIREMGRALGGEVAGRHGSGERILLFENGEETSVKGRFEEGLRESLSQAGFELVSVSGDRENGFRNALESLCYPAEQDAVVIALDPDSLLETAELLEESDRYRPYVKGVYGRGTSIPVLNALDEGWITGLCVTDDFSAGYLCARLAVDGARGTLKKTEISLPFYYIEREALREPRYEKMLYPIE